MALEGAESFDLYGTDADGLLENGFAGVTPGMSLVTDPDGISTQRCLFFPGDPGINGYAIRRPLDLATEGVGCSMRVWMDGLPANSGQCPPIMIWSDSGNVEMGRLQIDTTGRMSFYRTIGTVRTLAGTTSAPVVSAGTWWHIEAFMLGDTGAAGTFELRVEGSVKLDLTGLDFDSATVYQMTHSSDGDTIGAGPPMYMKDLVWWNTEGTENNDFLGRTRNVAGVTDSDITLGDWTPYTGTTGWDILDNNPGDDTKYLEAADTDTAQMVYGMTNLPADVSAVKGVFTVVRVGKVDGGDASIQVGVISSAVPALGTDRPIAQSQHMYQDLFEVDPNTGVAWSPGAVDAIQVSVDRTE